jgi:hypothetical protein
MKQKAYQAQSVTYLLVGKSVLVAKSVLVENTISILCRHKIAGGS